MSVLEYGCGTAALSFLLSRWVGPITAADASPGMIAEAQRKVKEASSTAITPRCLDLTLGGQAELQGHFDLVASAMVLHHVENTEVLLAALRALLRPGGYLALADLCQEDGSFHGEMPVPHHGFAPDSLAEVLTRQGFTACTWRRVHTISKQGRDYPVFLLTAGLAAPA
jgi:SAM-dependent methyltransferase